METEQWKSSTRLERERSSRTTASGSGPTRYGLIGSKYLDAGWGKRVCQIYADSREWDTRAYPAGFFDTAFIDGGHAADIVANDTRRAIQLVRPGGLVVWHDFCPLDEVDAVMRAARATSYEFIIGAPRRDWRAFHEALLGGAQLAAVRHSVPP